MKPYVFKKSKGKWTQEGINVEYRKKTFRYDDSEKPTVMSCLSFTYHFTDSE